MQVMETSSLYALSAQGHTQQEECIWTAIGYILLEGMLQSAAAAPGSRSHFRMRRLESSVAVYCSPVMECYWSTLTGLIVIAIRLTYI